MKKIIFTFYALILLFSKQAFSQTLFYDIFAKEGTEWSVGERSSVDPPWQVDEVFFLKLQGEETINDTTYHRLVKINEFNGIETGIHAYLRIDEDSSLFLRDIHGNQEKLFDYSMDIGDSIYIDFWVYRGEIQYAVSGGEFIKLNSILTVQINGETKTRWETQLGDWTQEIGSTVFMLDVFQFGFGYTGYETELLCVFNNQTQVYHTQNFPYCDLTFNSIIESDKALRIYPNPTSDIININFNRNTSGSYIIYNSVGNVVKSCVFDQTLNEEINISYFPKGFFLIHIFQENGISSIKKIVKC